MNKIENGIANSGLMFVNLTTSDGTTYTCDTDFEDIVSALSNNITVIARYKFLMNDNDSELLIIAGSDVVQFATGTLEIKINGTGYMCAHSGNVWIN